MKERLFIHLGTQMTDAIDWCVLANDGFTVADSGRVVGVHGLAQLTDKSKGRQVICYVPGTEVLMTTVNFPASQRRQIRRGLPFMLEEQLVNPLETSHFALPARVTTEEVPVVVASKDKMAEWTELFEAAQIVPDYLLPDCLSLPNPEHCSVSLVYDDVVLTRHDIGKAWVAEKDMFALMLPLHVPKSEEGEDEEDNSSQDILVYGDMDGEITQLLLDKGFNAESSALDIPIHMLAESFDPKSINLLQGDFSLKQDYSELTQSFKPALIAIAVFVVLQGAWLLTQSLSLEKQITAVNKEITQIYREVFPKSRGSSARARQANLKNELRKFQSGGAELGFLSMLESVHRGLKPATGVKPSGMNYDKKKSLLKIDINGKDIQVLEKFKEQTAALGFQVTLSNIAQQGDGYRGRVVITGEE